MHALTPASVRNKASRRTDCTYSHRFLSPVHAGPHCGQHRAARMDPLPPHPVRDAAGARADVNQALLRHHVVILQPLAGRDAVSGRDVLLQFHLCQYRDPALWGEGIRGRTVHQRSAACKNFA